MFIGLVAGGLLAALDWRAVFWVNVPVGIFGTLWAYRKLRDAGRRAGGRIDWWGNITFAVGLGAVLIGVTVGIQHYRHQAMGWANPTVVGLLAGGLVLLAAFVVIETKAAEPLFQLSLFRIRAFTAGNVAGFAVSIARGGLQFMLIIWSSGCMGSGCRCTATTTARRRCGAASSCCPSPPASSSADPWQELSPTGSAPGALPAPE